MSNVKMIKRSTKWSYIKTIEEAQIAVNSTNVKSKKELKRDYPSLYHKLSKKKLLQSIILDDDITNKYNTFEEIQKFVTDNNIKSYNELTTKYHYIVTKIKNNNINKYDICFSNGKYMNKSWKHITSIESVNKFIKDNNITSYEELHNNYKGLVSKIYTLGYNMFDLNLNKNVTTYYNCRTIEDVQEFISSKNIKTLEELNEKYYSLIILIKNYLNISDGNVFFNTHTSFDYTKIKEDIDIQYFIDSHNIHSIEHMKYIYNDFCKYIENVLNMKLEDFIFPNTYSNKKYNNVIDLQKIVDERNIQNSKDFRKRFPTLFCNNIGLLKELKYKNPYKSDYSHLNTIEDFQQFINTNDIQTYHIFISEYQYVYQRFIRKRLDKNLLSFKYNSNKSSWLNFDTIDKIQTFIEMNNICSKKDLYNKYNGLYKHILHSNNNLNIRDLNFDFQKNDWMLFKNKEDFQNFIDKMNIQNIKDFKKSFGGVQGRLIQLGLKMSDFNYPNQTIRNVWTNIHSIEDVQIFIYTHNILSIGELRNMYPSLLAKIEYLKLDKNELVFKLKRYSLLEIKTMKFLDNYNIKYIQQYKFSDLKDKFCLRFDFYLPDYNILLEPGGWQHLIYDSTMYCNNYTLDEFNTQIYHDNMKKEYCKRNNYKLLYYFFIDKSKTIRDKCNNVLKTYDGEWYTDFNKFSQRILELCNIQKTSED